MESVVLQMYFDGSWEELTDGRFEYKNRRNRAFLVLKNCTFAVFLARVYEVL